MRYGKLVVLRQSPGAKWFTWVCRCDCGAIESVNMMHPNDKYAQRMCRSCQMNTPRCNQLEAGKSTVKMPEYQSWSHAKARCFNPNEDAYASYGGRGITMCDEWRRSFLKFYEYMGPRPEGHTLDRIDTNGHYEPGNCRWATRSQQVNNRRPMSTGQVITASLHMSDWCRLTGLRAGTIRMRLDKGWPVERAVLEPLNER
jgi:hypothetical protein